MSTAIGRRVLHPWAAARTRTAAGGTARSEQAARRARPRHQRAQFCNRSNGNHVMCRRMLDSWCYLMASSVTSRTDGFMPMCEGGGFPSHRTEFKGELGPMKGVVLGAVVVHVKYGAWRHFDAARLHLRGGRAARLRGHGALGVCGRLLRGTPSARGDELSRVAAQALRLRCPRNLGPCRGRKTPPPTSLPARGHAVRAVAVCGRPA